MREIARRVNEVLRSTYHSRRQNGDIYAFRLMFTKYPEPTLSVVIYENRQKLTEIPIRNLDEFIDAIDQAYEILTNELSDTQNEEPETNPPRGSRRSTRQRSESSRRSSSRTSNEARSRSSRVRSSRRRLRRD